MCQEVGHDWSCSYGGPDGVRLALQAQLDRSGYLARNNEIVLAIESVIGNLPNAIEGIFYMRGADPVHEGNARNVHATFLKAFGLTRDTGPPLIVLDLADGVGQPFVLAN